MTERGRSLAGIAGVVLLVLLVHGRALGHDWVFDDYRFVVQNPALDTLGDPLRFFTDPDTADPDRTADIYRPLRTLNFAVDRALFGKEPFGYHLEALLLHALNAALVFLLLRRLAGGAAAAACGAALFAVHPAQVEAVAWVSSRADLLAALFTLLGLHAWLRAEGWDRWWGAAFACGVLAALSKEAAVVYPGFLVLVDLVRPGGGGTRTALSRWRLHLPGFLFAGAFAFLVKGMLERSRGLSIGHLYLDWWGGSWWVNLGLAAEAGAYQVLFTLFPFRPSVDWYLPLPSSPLEPGALLSLLLLLGLLGAGARAALRGRGAGARLAGTGVLLALLGGLMTSHLLFPVGIPTAERFLYFPLAGAGLVAAVLFRRLVPPVPAGGGAGPAVRAALPFALALAGLGGIAFARVGAWKDEDTLWREGPAGAFSPRALRDRLAAANNRLGEAIGAAAALQERGEEEEARERLETVLAELETVLAELKGLQDFWFRTIEYRLEDDFQARVHRNLSATRLRLGDPEGALREARAALSLQPGHPRNLAAAAMALSRLGRDREAGWRLERALRALEEARKEGEEEDPGAIPPVDGAAILNAAGADRVRRGLPGAALRALRASAALLPDGARNPAVARAPELSREIEAGAGELEARAARAPGDFAAAAALVAFRGVGEADMEAAREAFGRFFGKAPETPALRTLWALATMEADDTEGGWKAAEAYHRETLRLHPGDPGARLGLARCREALGAEEEARRLYGDLADAPGVPADVAAEARSALERMR